MSLSILSLVGQVLAALVLWQFLKISKIAFQKDLRKIPGPLLSRFTNFPLKWHTVAGTRNSYIDRLHKKYGSIVRIAPDEIGVSDVNAVHEIHRVGTPFKKGPWYHNLAAKQADDDSGGVFTIRDPRKASARRKLFLHAGSRGMVRDWEDQVTDVVKMTVAKIKKDLKKDGRVDVMKWWEFMTADVMGMIAFGESFRMVESEEKAPLLDDIAQLFLIMELQVELPWVLAVMRYLRIPLLRRLPGIVTRFNEYGNKAIANSKEAAKASTKTLFSKMVEPDQSPVPDQVVKNEAVNLLAAGAETTMLALTYLVYAVLSDETGKTKSRLTKELEICSDRPTWVELDNMPFLNNVIKESLRLYAPIGGTLPRTVPEEGVVLAGYKIPGGIVVETQALTLHTNPDVWKDPFKFDPDRWSAPTPEMKECFMAFGGSARYCVGQNIAQLELLRATAELFRECPEIKLAPETNRKTMAPREYFTGRPRGEKCEVVAA